MEKSTINLFGKPFAECISMDMDFRIPSSMRDAACLSYVYNGTQEVYSSAEKIVAKNNESILMKCGNYVANIVDATPENQFQSIFFHFDHESIKKAFGDKDLSFLTVEKLDEPIDPAIKVGQSELLDSFVASMMPYFDHPEMAQEELLATKLQELIYIVSNNGKNAIATKLIGTLGSPEKIEFNKVIKANVYNNLSLLELSFLTHRSKSTFKRDFKKWFSESPSKYFKIKRLEKAADLLGSTELQINHIAWKMGFDNAAHFSTSFLSYFGKSPNEYRD
ncbi:MAG: helix-turn-helix transcriptional regulator [Flavobacteriales bacterium]|nr:helix-turn-helix transcriptional regulator [Flavobacteriales bacterium]